MLGKRGRVFGYHPHFQNPQSALSVVCDGDKCPVLGNSGQNTDGK